MCLEMSNVSSYVYAGVEYERDSFECDCCGNDMMDENYYCHIQDKTICKACAEGHEGCE